MSSDEGKTWKKRWISPRNFDPRTSELNEGDLVKIGDAIHKAVITHGKLDCPLVKCENDEHDWENSTWYKQCRKCRFRITWIL